MRVLMVNHSTAGEWGGGDTVQMVETARSLRKLGIQVEIRNDDNPEVSGYDIVHIFNCRVRHAFPRQIKACLSGDAKFLVTPIWINLGRALWGSRGSVPILEMAANGEKRGFEGLELLKSEKLVVEMGNGNLRADGSGTYNGDWHQELKGWFRQVKWVLPNSWLELKGVQNDLHWKSRGFGVAEYGVNPATFLEPDPELFRNWSGIRGEFVVQAGRIEPGKNQAMLLWALRGTGIRVVLIGSGKHWPSYTELCKRIGGEYLTVIDHLPQDMLASAYAASSCHSLVSWMDTCGLVSLEAALSGTPIVGSTFGHELEYLRDNAWLADPGDEDSIRTAVLEAIESGRYNAKSRLLKERILSDYSWDRSALKTLEFYQRIINENA